MTVRSLIAFEGLDGSGKSTQAAALVQVLLAAGHDVVATREPTDGAFGRRIRELARGGGDAPAAEIWRWFHEDRREHVAAVIRPALDAGRVVVTDRYFLSSVAYQGALGLDPAEILRESEAEHPAPDLALLLEIEPGVGLERVHARPGHVEPLFERRDFLERAAGIYRSLDLPYLERIAADRPPDQIHRDVVASAARRLPQLGLALD